MLFLEDIYVQPAHRKSGAGTMLFKENIKFALQSQCKEMHWHVLGWNLLARDFYQKFGAENLTSCENGLQFFRFNQNAIQNCA